jgi:hypothetical protein
MPKPSAEEITRQLIELVESDMDQTMYFMAAILDTKRKMHKEDADFLKSVQRGADALRLASNKYRVVPDKPTKKEDETIAKLLADLK